MPSLKSIAQYAGVSVSTVSRVLNGANTKLPISEKTRGVVLAAANELNYVPDSAARALRRGKTRTIAVLGQDPSSFVKHGHFSSLVTQELLRAGVAAQYHLLLLTGMEAETGPYGMLADLGMADGILIVNRDLSAHPLLARLESFPKPVVYAFDYPETGGASTVAARDEAGGRLATRHLFELGHERIGFVDGPYFQQIFQRRRAGWRGAMKRAGITPPDSWCATLSDNMVEWIEREQLTAVIGANDGIAFQITDQCVEADFRIPEDISILSFSQRTAFAEPPPMISCVAQPIDLIIGDAVRQLVAQIEDQAAPREIRHNFRLLEQRSTGPV